MTSPIEKALRDALSQVQVALLSGDIFSAARHMGEAVKLCEEARRDSAQVSEAGLRELQRLFDACLETNRQVGKALEERLAASGKSNVARRVYSRRRLVTQG